jgi:hypothetical protein
MEPVLQLVILLAVVALALWVLLGPLRRHAGAVEARAAATGGEHAELEAARDAKYREIREAELDYRTGKLSEADYRAIDGDLRAEAIEILRRLDRVQGVSPPAE